MRSRKKVTRISQKQRELDELANEQAHLSFFSKLKGKISAKVGGAVISALIVLHFISQFIFFQNEIVHDEITPPKIENVQIAEIKPEYESAQPDVVTVPEPYAPPSIAKAERKASRLPKKMVKKKQSRESKAGRLRHAERTERDFRAEEVANVFPHGRFLTQSATY